MKRPERWLVVHLRQNGKNKTWSYCYGTAVTAQRQVETATAQRNFSRRQRNSYGIYVIGNRETATAVLTATEWWKPGISYIHLTAPSRSLRTSSRYLGVSGRNGRITRDSRAGTACRSIRYGQRSLVPVLNTQQTLNVLWIRNCQRTHK